MVTAMSKLSCGEIVRRQREHLGLTREQLAAQCGVSTSTIARLELNNQLPKTRSLSAIANRLGIPVSELLVELVAS
jgi:transcriptional regulator with XRE-family HTH domain